MCLAFYTCERGGCLHDNIPSNTELTTLFNNKTPQEPGSLIFTLRMFLQMLTTDYMPFSWDLSSARVTTRVSSLELKNSTGHVLNITELKSPVSIKIKNTQDSANNSRPHYVGANKTVYHKINVTTPGMALILKVRPENDTTEFSVFVKYQERPSLSNSDLNTTIPDFSSCSKASSGYANCSRDPYVMYVDSEHVNQTGYYFVGIQIKARSPGKSRKRRCSGQGRSKRSCVRYKEPPTTPATYNVPEYLQGDENYTMQVLPAACLYWNTEMSKWTREGCKVRTLKFEITKGLNFKLVKSLISMSAKRK